MKKIGCFEIVELGPGRWQMRNERIDVSHVTYGTAKEVEARALRQTAAWKRKLDGPHLRGGAGWRNAKAPLDAGVVLVVEGVVPDPVRR